MQTVPKISDAPPKVALSRQERFLEAACHASRAAWGGMFVFSHDGQFRDHVTSDLNDEAAALVRHQADWIATLWEMAQSTKKQWGSRAQALKLPGDAANHACIGIPWSAPNHGCGVVYVVRDQGHPFGPAEEAALQAITRLLVQESQQDEVHLLGKLRVLNQVAQAAAGQRDLDQLFALALLELERHIPWQVGMIWLCDQPAPEATLDPSAVSRLVLKGVSERAQRFNLARGERLDVEKSIFSTCVRESAAVYLDDGQLAAGADALAQSLARAGASAAFAVPLRAGSSLLGVLVSVCIRPGGFTNEQIQLFYLIADLLGPATAQALWLQRLLGACDELRTAQGQLVQTEKMRALGEMASGMAHDFNNALCGVLGFLELTLLEPGLPPSCRGYLESSKTCALDAAQTVRRVQEFARRQRVEGEMRPLELDDLVRQALELTRPKWESLKQLDKRIAAEIVTSAGCRVNGNASELREALTNLIFNAVDAMPHGGKLSIRTWTAGRDAYIAVQDSGVGIPDEIKRRLFEPFFTTKGERGTGMGLPVTFGIVERHQGTITVASEPGRGATFTLRLPVLNEGASANLELGTENVATGTTARILVVEDDENIRCFLSMGLTEMGYEPLMTPSAEEALEVMKTKEFDLVLTDLGLPGMNGAELARVIKIQSPGKPVVLLTGWGEQIQAENQQLEGIASILAKPVTISKLASTLASVRTA